MKKILFTLLSTVLMVAPAQARHLYVGTVESPTVVRERVHVMRPNRLHVITPSWRRERRVRIGEPAFVERTRMSRVHILRDRDRDDDMPRFRMRTRESRVRFEPRSSFIRTKRVERRPDGVTIKSKTVI